ncbi:MAG: recombinase family protein [Clostridiales bacterium]|nr:recombinase family protein [Clostridiales bacterium]
MTNGACYIRVSTSYQEELSPDAQKRLLLDYAKEHDIIITEDSIYWEIGISGRKTDNRPSFRQMIAAAKSPEHPYDVVLVWKFSRFARNQEESIVYKSLLKKSGVEVVSVSEPLPDGIMGGLIERILEWMDEYYSIRLSGEVMRGMTEKALRGGYQAVPPLGYDRKRGETPTVNEQEAELVRMIFRMYVEEGRSLTAIAKIMNLGKYPTKRGAHWNMTHIRYMLGNPFYIGKIRWNHTSHMDGRNVNDPSEWIVSDGVHEPLIDEETFQKAQELLKSRPGWTPGHIPARHWMSGLLRCTKCGGPMIYSTKTKRNNASMRCLRRTQGLCDVWNRITIPRLEEAVCEGLELTFRSCSFEHIRKTIRALPVDTEAILRGQLDELEKKERRIRKAYMDGIDSLAEYKENRQLIDRQRAELSARLASFSGSPPDELTQVDRLQMVSNIGHVLEILKDEEAEMLKKADAIRSIYEKVTYDKAAEKLTFYFIL